MTPNMMSYEALREEIKYIAGLLDEQPGRHEAYLAELAEAFAKKANARSEA